MSADSRPPQVTAATPAAGVAVPMELGRDRGLVLRPEIVSSWQRSASSGLAPDHFSVPEHEPELESKFVRAARPVLRRISADLAALDVSLILTDDSANILMRSDGSRSIRARLDRVSLGPGYAYSEDSVGTNAIGTALAMGTPMFIMGREHFADVLTRLSCAAAPVVDPVSRHVVGALDLTSSADNANPLMLGFARSGAREIEQRMVALMPLVQQSAPAAQKAWQLLTPAEREVADLVSTGLTNKKIAATLCCSPYTVDSRLRAIYRKFGVASRAALASHMTRLNGAAPARSETSAQGEASASRF
jgi:transcriptional regulator of acetoin/glycerol metabolism